MLSEHEILVCLDANEKWESKNSTIKEFGETLGLIDMAGQNLSPPPPTFERKGVANRIDFILATQRVSDCLHEFEMEPEILAGSCGDHRGMIIKLKIGMLFNLKDQDMMGPTSRKLKSNDVKGVEKYKNKLLQGIDTHNIAQRMKTLITELQGKKEMNANQKQLYEGIDKDMFRLCINAEKNIRRGSIGNYMWSPSLDKAHRDSQYWKSRKKTLVLKMLQI